MRRGHTLFELCAVLLLASMAGSVLLPAARNLRDLMAVLAAREAVAGLVAQARAVAQTRGRADLHLAGGPWRAWVAFGQDTLGLVSLGADLGVEVHLSRKRASTTLRYDALGLGRVASETIAFRRGGVERLLVISGYGRLRRP